MAWASFFFLATVALFCFIGWRRVNTQGSVIRARSALRGWVRAVIAVDARGDSLVACLVVLIIRWWLGFVLVRCTSRVLSSSFFWCFGVSAVFVSRC